MFTSESVKAAVSAQYTRLFFPWLLNRPEGWTCDARTRDVICLGFYIREVLQDMQQLADEDRRTQEALFNRYSRSDLDIYLLAAMILNDALDGKVDTGRKTHRRWG